MNVWTRILIVSLAALLPLAACGKGEIKNDEAPKSGSASGPAAGAASAPAAGSASAPAAGDAKAPAGDAKQPAAAEFDHSKFDGILKKFVNTKGRVNYKGIKGDAAAMTDLKAYLETIATADASKMSRDAKLAFYINAYNASTMKAVIDRYPLKSVMDVKDPDFFKGIKHKVAGEEMTLDTLENGKIRGEEFSEARIHFVVNCASISCPRLRRDAITAANLEVEMEAGAKEYVLQETKVDVAKKSVDTSKIFEWFAGDFKKASGSVNAFLAKYHDDSAQAEAIKAGSITTHEYDWDLNEAKE